MAENEEHIIFSKWVNNDLSAEELAKLEESGDLQILEQIMQESSEWTLPPSQLTYEKIKEQRKNLSKNSNVFSIQRAWWMAAAAVLLISSLIGLYQVNFSTTDYATAAGEIKNIELPDGTKVLLNGNSSISFKSYNWEENRALNLKGAAYFNVTKKGPFSVDFNGAKVAVLGTKFTILSSPIYHKVTCHEGKVKVLNGADEYVLTKGMQVDSDKLQTNVDVDGPSWEQPYSEFKNAKLREVLATLQMRFNYDFDTSNVDLDKKYTGQYTNTDGLAALKMVFNPLQIKYKVEGNYVLLNQ